MEQEIAPADTQVDSKAQQLLAADALLNGEFDSTMSYDDQLAAIEKFIDKLPHLNTLDRYWARSDAEKMLKSGEDLGELKKKYEFYNHAGKIRNAICKRAPDGKGGTVCNLIDDEILNVDSGVRDRKWKIEVLLKIQSQLDKYFQEKNIVPFVQRQESVAESVVTKILLVLDSNFRETFGKFQEQLGAAKFWELQREMSPAEFPNFTAVFNFRKPQDFFKKLTRKNLFDWPQKLKKSLLRDADELIVDEEVFCSRREEVLRELRGKRSVAELVERLLELKLYRDQQIPRLKQQQKKETEQREQKKLEQQKKDEQKRQQEKMTEQQCVAEGKEKKMMQKKERTEKKTVENSEKKGEPSVEKQKILHFYDRCIEHAEKLLEECGKLGIPDSAPEFWSNAGVKNRRQWLQNPQHNFWDMYVKFNRNDKNIPSHASADGFRFRWLNVNTGSRINGAAAESGMRYLDRYKESGYSVALLASGLSLDYTGSSSTCLDPRRFIEKVQAAKSKISS